MGRSDIIHVNIFINLYYFYTIFFIRYEDLELFKEIEPADLDYLGIINTDHRAKLLTAVQLLHDIDCKIL